MFATRLPVFTRLNIAEKNTLTREEINKMIPASVRWKADNFSNLFEQPTQFYAVAVVLAIVGGGKTDARLAWARFGLYLISSGLVAVLTGRAALLLAA
ncbi:hypothetical protein VE02_08410 [Pseudogymnoascus sp. 03VT05]|nr:hypothetical protein VE02_08410 [Pseudogymnoascus sp. 03VT05]